MSGCTNQTLDCSFGFVGIIAGIAGGAIAGITIGAALLVAGATVGGSAYAISRHQSGEGDSNVRQNPLFRGATRGNDNPLGRPGK